MKYRVSMPYVCYVTVETEADNSQLAIGNAYYDGCIRGYCGTGASGKIIIVSGDNFKIEVVVDPGNGSTVEHEIYVEEIK